MNKYSVRGPDLNLAQLGNPACPTSAAQFWNLIRRSHECPSDSIASGVEQAENFVGFFMHRKCRLQLIQNNILGHIPRKLVLVPLCQHFQCNKAV